MIVEGKWVNLLYLRSISRVNADWLVTGKTKTPQNSEEKAKIGEVRDEEPATYNSMPTSPFAAKSHKKIQKVVVLYADGSFDDYRPNEQ